MTSLKYGENYQYMTQRHKVSKHCWKNGTDRLERHRVAANLQLVKNALSAKCNKTRSAYS